MRALALALALTIAAPAQAAPADDYKALIAEHWAWYLRGNPVLATTLGVHDYDTRIADVSLATADTRAIEAQGFLTRLGRIPDAGLAPEQRAQKAILARLLGEQVEGNRFPERMILFTSYASPHQDFAGLADSVPMRTRADYDSYAARLAAYPTLINQVIAVTTRAMVEKIVQPCVTLVGFDKTISGLNPDDPRTSRYYAPYLKSRPPGVDAAAWSAMQEQALTTIRGTIYPENQRLLTFYNSSYLPRCRKTVGISALPQGKAYYAYAARVHTTTDMTPDQIHEQGLSEVARIGAEMDALAKSAGFPNRAAFIAKLHSDPAYYAKTPEALMQAAALQAKTIDGKLPNFFGKLPRLPYGIRQIPAETAEGTTTAYYMPGSPTAGIAGTFYVNTSKLDQRPLWELPALTAHEAVPGHHNQIALQQELDLPEFLKNGSGFDAFVEGWALYSEHLGIEMGLYDTPEKNMGRLSYEMWRACRLVVDTGIHAQGWTKERAVAFMRDNTALSDANIDAEVNRYISWPGQALAYKLGELKIRALRARAEQALGAKFDLRAFHDAVLGGGAMPLDVLERRIDDWIAAQRG